MSDIFEELFKQKVVEDVSGISLAFFFGPFKDRRTESITKEECEFSIEDGKLFGQDYESIKVGIIINYVLREG